MRWLGGVPVVAGCCDRGACCCLNYVSRGYESVLSRDSKLEEGLGMSLVSTTRGMAEGEKSL